MDELDGYSAVTDLNAARNQKRKTQCPLCKKATSSAYFPFCSLACKEEDLGNWITGKYFIPEPDQTSLDRTTLAANDGSENSEDLE